MALWAGGILCMTTNRQSLEAGNRAAPGGAAVSEQRHWALKQVLFSGVLDELQGHFAKMQVLYMPIKGAYLIAAGLADRIPCRRIWDVDILVREADLDAVAKYFAPIPGVTVRKSYAQSEWPFETELWYRYSDADVPLEIHGRLNFAWRFLLPTDMLFANGKQITSHMLVPRAEHALLILTCHCFVHIAFELPESVFDEIGVIAGQPDFSWERFFDDAAKTGIMPFVYWVLCLYEIRTGNRVPFTKRPWYGRALARILSYETYLAMPRMVRRLVLEAPVMRSRAGMVAYVFPRMAGKLLSSLHRTRR
ncbi:MAG: hypothetical protein GF410_06645 [Chitinivibrionales bacterium]|nr:hypothetical protein [Chitinivibrionales bacterium]